MYRHWLICSDGRSRWTANMEKVQYSLLISTKMSKQKSILLAEDDENLGQLLQTFLKAKGFHVDLARNGKQAYERFAEGHFDFCIFDVMMPEMDGFTLAKEVRQIDPKTPILFLTAKSMKE